MCTPTLPKPYSNREQAWLWGEGSHGDKLKTEPSGDKPLPKNLNCDIEVGTLI